MYSYLEDNVLLTRELTSVPHRKFVFVSTVDVYPAGTGPRSEDEIYDVDDVGTLYGTTKLMSEAIVGEHCADNLILRCVALLGRHARKNSLLRIVQDEPCVLTLAGDSRFNYVLHSDVSEFIDFAIESDLSGIYNVASSENVSLSEIADFLDKEVEFGEYRYDVGAIDNRKISSVFPAFTKTSWEIVTQFVEQLGE